MPDARARTARPRRRADDADPPTRAPLRGERRHPVLREDGSLTSRGTYLLYMLTGEAALDDLQNDRYPDIRPTTLEQRLTAAVGA